MAELHIVGAGLAGLAAAVEASGPGRPWAAVHLYEATAAAGGRCRSFHDRRLDRLIDNGNHLLLGANRAALGFLRETGGLASMIEVAPAVIPFVDLETGDRWALRPKPGPLPGWLFAFRRHSAARERLLRPLLRLGMAGAVETVAGALGPPSSRLYRRLWEPMATAILNTDPADASAVLFRRVLLTLAGAGERAMRPYFAAGGLSAALVVPALRLLEARGMYVQFGRRLQALEVDGERATALRFGGGRLMLGRDDAILLALPPQAAAAVIPTLRVPTDACPIVNLHFRLPEPVVLPDGVPYLGLVGGTAQWLFVRDDIASVTVSAAERLLDEPAESIAARIWADLARAVPALADLPKPHYRVIKERRATMAQTPAQLALRPSQRTGLRNVALAGDWVDTGLPATIEAAVRSGRRAARLLAGL